MNEVELERLICRLIGDSSSYDTMLQNAGKTAATASAAIQRSMSGAEQVTRSVETATERYTRKLGENVDMLNKGGISQETFRRAVERDRQEMENAGKAAGTATTSIQTFLSGLAGVGAALGIGLSARGSFEQFNQMQAIQIRLKDTLITEGAAVDSTMKKYSDFADEMERTTTVGRTEAMSLLSQAEAMGKTGDAAMVLSQNAIAFGAATGRGAEGGMHLALAMSMGNTMMLKYGLGLRGVTDDNKVLQIAQERLAAGFQIERDMAQTTQGQMKQLGNAMQDIEVSIGGVIAKALNPIVGVMTELARLVEVLPGPFMVLLGVVVMLAAAFGIATAAVANWTALTAIGTAATAVWTAVMATLNAVMEANPIGLVVAGIAAAVLAVAALVSSFNDETAAVDAANKKLDEHKAKLAGENFKEMSKVKTDIEQAPAMAMDNGRSRENYFSVLKSKKQTEEDNLELVKKHRLDALNQAKSDYAWNSSRANDAKLKEVQADYDDITQKVNNAKDAVAQFDEQMGLAKNHKATQEEITSAIKLTNALYEQAHAAGLAGSAAEAAKMKIQGIPQANIDAFKKAAEFKAVKTDIAESTQGLADVGKGETQKKIEKTARDEGLPAQEAMEMHARASTLALAKQNQAIAEEADLIGATTNEIKATKIAKDNWMDATQKATVLAGLNKNSLATLIEKYKEEGQEAGLTAAQLEGLKATRMGLSEAEGKQVEMAALRSAGQKAVGAAELDLRKQIALVGKSDNDKKLYELAQQGATQADLERVHALQKQLDLLNANAKAQEKLTGLVAGSAEAKAAIRDYQQHLKGSTLDLASLTAQVSGAAGTAAAPGAALNKAGVIGGPGVVNAPIVGLPGVGAGAGAAGRPAAGDPWQQSVVTILKEIRDGVRVKTPKVTLVPAELE